MSGRSSRRAGTDVRSLILTPHDLLWARDKDPAPTKAEEAPAPDAGASADAAGTRRRRNIAHDVMNGSDTRRQRAAMARTRRKKQMERSRSELPPWLGGSPPPSQQAVMDSMRIDPEAHVQQDSERVRVAAEHRDWQRGMQTREARAATREASEGSGPPFLFASVAPPEAMSERPVAEERAALQRIENRIREQQPLAEVSATTAVPFKRGQRLLRVQQTPIAETMQASRVQELFRGPSVVHRGPAQVQAGTAPPFPMRLVATRTTDSYAGVAHDALLPHRARSLPLMASAPAARPRVELGSHESGAQEFRLAPLRREPGEEAGAAFGALPRSRAEDSFLQTPSL